MAQDLCLQMLLPSHLCWRWLECPVLQSRGDTSLGFKEIPSVGLSAAIFKPCVSLKVISDFIILLAGSVLLVVCISLTKIRLGGSKRGKVELLCLLSQKLYHLHGLDMALNQYVWQEGGSGPALGTPGCTQQHRAGLGGPEGSCSLLWELGRQRGGSLSPACAALESPPSLGDSSFHCKPFAKGSGSAVAAQSLLGMTGGAMLLAVHSLSFEWGWQSNSPGEQKLGLQVLMQ